MHIRGKKQFKVFCLISFVLVITLAVLQRSSYTKQTSRNISRRFTSPERRSVVKFLSFLTPTGNFWRPQKPETTATATITAATRETKHWDVTDANCTPSNFTRTGWLSGLEPNFEQFLRYRHCRYFPIILNHPEKCSGHIYLLIIVKSIITQYDRREVIRKTWGRQMQSDGKQIKTLFLLGISSTEHEGSHHQKLLEYENIIYGDILQWDFMDTFFNLTLKEVNFLRWFSTYCENVEYIFKGDDDVFVSTENILEFLNASNFQNLFVGDVLYKAKPIRKKENKYYIPEGLYNKTYYPPYVGGGGFVMSGSLAQQLYVVSEGLELYPIDDVFLGMCLELLGITPINHCGFKTFGLVKNKSSKMNKEPCFYQSMLVVHKLLPAELLEMWKLVHSSINCSKKMQIL
ncbi:UDP-GlcNAc:betaGal beta-1,3-N-acetylglucosaminyltransferase 7 isoform X2 [Amblyraja radiata]|nr:UDP-GlcNAc:betaGal beta-1,3-N-acetylglucosaminyltransferase 7 isoform X2 [Amblyraja radiata]XP_032887249.1 UDP-GlcNAc:betaGal beta-1,3-N-acetylglucosaminyltransferase 7 isoform X2 [Amblyraja radiata]XP_032887250.1 UDP-GlcNAc:betaGal beta-1,3-N-acetylglucosaminyltransferase 7 isoform X2 [Amblyraja radiata]XP_032887251.1 UDP-GlcNAc:betaGal beta-1,3-N-acetylglucosaminyltransferase 7 isoform X2 [Amblyraja radiata]